MNGQVKVGTRIVLGMLGLMAWGSNWAEGGGWARRRAANAAPTATAVPAPTSYGAAPMRTPIPAPTAYVSVPKPTSFEPSPYPMLGTFYPTPSLMVRGNWPAGGGYSPLGS